MNKLSYIIFLTIFFLPFLTRSLNILPGPAVLIFELISGFSFLAAMIYASYYKVIFITPKYLILFLAVCLHFLVGVVINSVDPYVIISGIRNYLKYTPLFLLPLVYAYSDKEISGQLKFLVVLCLLQFPLVVIQFFILGWHPDIVAGTLGIGSIMSMIMVCAIAILTAFYLRGRISAQVFLVLGLLLFIPTTLNESKGTIIMLALGLIVIMLGARVKKSRILVMAGAATIMISSFIVIYNVMFAEDYAPKGGGFAANITMDPNKGFIFYLWSGDSIEIDPVTALEAPSAIIGALPSLDPEQARIRRVDAIVLPVRILSEDPIKLLVGLGIGNASDSRIGPFAGQYSFLAGLNNSMPALPVLLWEIGVCGVLLYLIFFYFIFSDARQMARTDSISGVLALGWTGVVVILILSLPYKNFLLFEASSALFWYLSGYIAAQRYRLSRGEKPVAADLHPSTVSTRPVNMVGR